jgi:hypothetical protein
MEKKIENIENQLEGMKELIIKLNDNIELLNKKIDNLEVSLDEELIPECKKMGSHIDFIEKVYDTVKHPLGFICNKVKGITNSETYTLTDISGN